MVVDSNTLGKSGEEITSHEAWQTWELEEEDQSEDAAWVRVQGGRF